MKKKLKNYPFILLILLSLYSCLNEDVVNKMEHHHKYGFNTVSINDIPSIITPIEKFNKNYSFLRNNINGYKTAKFENLNLNLDLDNILQLNENQYNSYSIRILDSESEDQYYFENLHIIEKDTLTYSFITKWYPENPNIKFELKTFSGIMKKYDLQYNVIAQYDFINGSIQSQQNNKTTGKYTLECNLTSYCGCSGEPWCGCNGDYYQCRWVVSYACYLANNSTGGGNDGGNNDTSTGETSGGGGGSSQNDSDNNPFVPNPPEELNEEMISDEKKCVLFNKLKNDQPFKDIVNVLKTGTSLTYEQGVALTNQSNGSYNAIIGTANSNNDYAVEYNIPNGTIIDIFIHNHYTGGLSIFSPDDIEQMYNYIKNIPTVDYNSNFVSIVVTPNQEVYAMTITDKAAFIAFGDEWMSTPEKFEGFRDLFYLSPEKNFGFPGYGINKESSNSNNEKNFMRLLNRNSGIKIHKANADLSQWNPLKLSPSNTVISETPCN